MNEKIRIDFDKKTSQFFITCPFYANELVRGLPSVRWRKAVKAWGAPLIRKNVEYIDRQLRPFAEMTDGAEREIEEAKKRYAAMDTGAKGFPTWYPFKTEPLPHQLECLNKLYGLEGAAIFMDPGLGKSKVAIDINCALRMEGKIDAWLVVCKFSLLENFAAQIMEHAPIPVSIHIPNTTKIKEYERWVKSPEDFKCLIVGTESLSNGRMIEIAESYLMSFAKPSITLDESSLISNHGAIRSERVVGFRVKSVYRQAMTGTPISEGPLNLFMQFQFLDPEIIGIGDFYAFRNRYAVMGGYMREDKKGNKRPVQIIGYQNIDELTKTIAPYTYEQNKEILKLPPKRYEVRHVNLTREQRELYLQIKREKQYQIDGRDVVPKNVLELLLRLHQVCGGFIGETVQEEQVDGRFKQISRITPIIPDNKNPKLLELLDATEEIKGQGVIWTAYRSELAMIEKVLVDKYGRDQIRTLHGDTDKEERTVLTRDFERGDFKWIISNPQTGGMGFTWNAAEVAIYFSMTHKMVDRIQSEDRIHRIGQSKSVRIIDILARGTIDELIKKSNDQKMDLADFVRTRIREYGQSIDDLLGGANGIM